MSTDEERLQLAQWLLEKQINWIGTADAKAAFVATLDIALLGILAALKGLDKTETTAALLWCGVASTLTICSLVCTALCVKPKLNGPAASMIFFGRVVGKAESTYVADLIAVSARDMLTDTAAQVHCNAGIANDKHEWVKWAMGYAFASILPWAIAIAYLLG